jgi:tRNA (mo5U34)-methyltransferase
VSALAAEVRSAHWYHTLELPGGVLTPGEYDLRPALARVPLAASLVGRRCLDVGTRDGFWAFEMERRGAQEVVGIDVLDPRRLDWPRPRPDFDAGQAEHLGRAARAFDVAHRALGSRVVHRDVSVYDLPAAGLGRFDVAVIGTLLLHLRDPVGALMAIADVLDGVLVLNEAVAATLSLRPGPAALLVDRPGVPFWWVPNVAGLRAYLRCAGYEVLRSSGRLPYLLPNGAGLATPRLRLRGARGVTDLTQQLLLRRGMPHAWFEARPAESG